MSESPISCPIGRYSITWYIPSNSVHILPFSPLFLPDDWRQIDSYTASKVQNVLRMQHNYDSIMNRIVGFSGTRAGYPIDAGTLRRWSLPAPGEPARPASQRGHSRSLRSSSSPTPTRSPEGGAHRASSRMLLAAPPRSRGVRETANAKPLHITSNSSELGYNRAGMMWAKWCHIISLNLEII